ncbi:regulator of G-protein signaling 22 [Myxocyprinus asiaticus]|uniref:regulator of G-protein signaling 22 n=1 Tax=Myxocyprinus asiaticus TaxID=70543 RepID=UPI002222AE69|nr:regulator of G-protein signaling 22 [Myxocyprinus asiaticus]
MTRAVPDLPEITSDNFEESFSSDQIFIQFFNDFLLLPVFAVPVRYDWVSAGFELVDQTAVDVSRRIRTSLHELQSRTLSEPNWIPADPVTDNSYTVTCLDRDQTIQWLKRDRLVFFLQSDCYFEYRLAKCLSQLSAPVRSKHHMTADASLSCMTLCDECCVRSGQKFCSFSDNMNSSRRSQNTPSLKTSNHSTANDLTAVQTTKHCATPVTPALETAGRSCNAGVHDDRQRFLNFKRFLEGGQGENVLHLWMDIERLKTHNTETKSRYLVWMRSEYVVSTSAAALSVELLSRLGLNSTICWQEDTLRHIQPHLFEILLLYWGQRFSSCVSDQWYTSEHGFSSVYANLCTHSATSLPTYIHLPACICSTICAEPRPAFVCSNLKVDSRALQTLLEVLQTESRSGFFFTHFCQNSGNKLWENAVHFCSELQRFHSLFNQSTFDPYRVQHTAQLLYVSYVCSGAQMSVGLSEIIIEGVLVRLNPAFEDLFDGVEEHVLTLLLEPWTLLSNTLTQSLRWVALWEEVRYAETELFNTLQTLYTHTNRRLQQVTHTQTHRRLQKVTHSHTQSHTHTHTHSHTTEFVECRTADQHVRHPDLWSKVPASFRGFRLTSLIQNQVELQHFLSFLEENSASMHLQCWLDIKQLMKTPQDDEDLLKKRNTNIKAQYLTSNFLFGPSSPASEEQQTRLLQMCGGYLHLQRECVSVSVLTELQSVVQDRLESHWLPLFLSSSKFITRHKPQVHLSDGVCEQSVVRQYRRRRHHHQWKAVVGVMSSCQECVSLRSALLNPVTRLQFQKFVCARDDLLENDLLFWLEVQRYKDLCHSHSDDMMIQRKINIIISCFITSSLPPALQIHIPPDLAERITSQWRALGPYVFREAQVCVFNELLKHWPDFVAFRAAVGEQHILRVLEDRQRERQTIRQTDEQDDSRSQEEEEETRAATDEEQQQNCDEMREVTYKICWSYSKHMAALEQQKSQSDIQEEVTSSSETGRHTSSSRCFECSGVKILPLISV